MTRQSSSSAACDRINHQLRITVDFERRLTIVFPHDNWAARFCDHVNKIYGSIEEDDMQDMRAELQGCQVQMYLPKDVSCVEVDKIHVPGNFRVYVLFKFIPYVPARADVWLKDPKLWEVNENKKELRLRVDWTHADYNKAMGLVVKSKQKGLPRVNMASEKDRRVRDVFADGTKKAKDMLKGGKKNKNENQASEHAALG